MITSSEEANFHNYYLVSTNSGVAVLLISGLTLFTKAKEQK